MLQDDTGALAHFHRRPDGVGLYVRQYNVPDGTKARGVVVFVHGWTWHSGYFAPFADYLTENGATLFASGISFRFVCLSVFLCATCSEC